LVKETGFPSMKVLQFAFDGDAENEYLPHNYKTSNCVVYTGTHDNDTLKGWVKSSSKDTKRYCIEYMDLKGKWEIAWGIIRLAWSSSSEIAIVQMQDILNEGSKSRMNTPSTLENNWTYRIKQKDLTRGLVSKLQELNRIYGR
ncbi:MAG: 4-alpha-glucanotransferase, partial [Clostridiales bacterium]|nr:4-alpha-glucanotransferase [Clostridiales bacterium]